MTLTVLTAALICKDNKTIVFFVCYVLADLLVGSQVQENTLTYMTI